MGWDIRIGPQFSADELKPLVYDTPGGPTEARLLHGSPTHVVNELVATYRVDETPWRDYELPLQPGTTLATKQGAEIFGAVRAFAYAGLHDVRLTTGFQPPMPDLYVALPDGEAFLEVTQVRPEGAFGAALREIQDALIERTTTSSDFASVFDGRRVDLGFIAAPPRRDTPNIVTAIATWLSAYNWAGGGVPEIPDELRKWVGSVVAFPKDPERPIRAAWLVNGRPIPDQASGILDAIQEKKRKKYEGAPLWLAITAVHAIGSLQIVRRAMVDPGQFDRIYITDAQDALTVMKTACLPAV